MATVPVDWGFSVPYGVVYAKYPAPHVGRFIEAVAKAADIAREPCAEVPDRVYSHMYRRMRATDLYRERVDLPLVSRMLGHASMETTKIYAKPSMKMPRDAMGAVARQQRRRGRLGMSANSHGSASLRASGSLPWSVRMALA